METASENKYYTTLDLKDAYFQVMLDEESTYVTTFSDGVSLNRFKSFPFGLNCRPDIFSFKTATILSSLIKQGLVRKYLDDDIFGAPDYDSTLVKSLDTLFQCFTQSGIKVNLSKCAFGHRLLNLLGHIVSEEGCKPDPSYVEAIQDTKAFFSSSFIYVNIYKNGPLLMCKPHPR